MKKYIHLDMDHYFTQVEQRDNPDLRGKPIAVGFDGPRGVISTASYEARRYGVHSAMSVARAKKLCPNLIIVPSRFEVYRQISEQIHSIIERYSKIYEPLSLDESYIDVSDYPSATLVAKELKAVILKETGLTASAGVSVNMMLAKIASDYRKPDGLFVIAPKDVEAFIATLPVGKFFGVGKVTEKKMHQLGIHTGSDLRQWDKASLVRHFGKMGHTLYGYARGIDDREIDMNYVRKSVGVEETFLKDIADKKELAEFLDTESEELWHRIESKQFQGKTIVLKIKFDDFQVITRSRTMPDFVADRETALAVGLELLDRLDFEEKKVRLIGLSVCNNPRRVESYIQLSLDFKEDE